MSKEIKVILAVSKQQAAYYTHLISKNPEWDFLGIYAEKESGTGINVTIHFEVECFNVLLEDNSDDFENVAIDLVCEGCMPQIVSEILLNLIQATSLSNMQYTKKILFAMFILMLQDGTFCLQDIKRV